MKRTFAVIVIFALLAFPSLSTAGEATGIDGNRWEHLEMGTKVTLMMGFNIGRLLGYRFSIWGLNEDDPCVVKNHASIREHERYIAGVTIKQTVDGLDSFYSDYRNRKIPLHNAAFIVLMSIAGDPQKYIDEFTLEFRQEASKQ